MPERKLRTIRHVRFARAVGLASRPRKRLPRQITPRPIEREYARRLLQFVAATREALAPLLEQLPGLMQSAARERFDAGEGKRIRDLIEQARARMSNTVQQADLDRLAEEFARRTATYQRVQILKQTRAALGVDVFLADRGLATLVDGFVSENVALIKSLPEQIIAGVEGTITRGVTSGKLHRDIAKDLEDRFGFGEDRAKLIARDQVGKFYGQVNATRQKELGIDQFIWRTSNDERVRDEHAVLEGEVFSFADGGHPEEGLPGEAINCRCFAEPVFDDLLAGLET